MQLQKLLSSIGALALVALGASAHEHTHSEQKVTPLQSMGAPALNEHVLAHMELDLDTQGLFADHLKLRQDLQTPEQWYAPITFQVTHGSDTYTVALHPEHHLFSPGFEILVLDEDGNKVKSDEHVDINVHYSGQVYDEAFEDVGSCTGSFIDGHLVAELWLDDGQRISLEPAHWHKDDTVASHVSFSYADVSEDLRSGRTCGHVDSDDTRPLEIFGLVEDENKKAKDNRETTDLGVQERREAATGRRQRRQFVANLNTCQLVLKADSLFFENVGEGNFATTVNTVTRWFNGANTIYKSTNFDSDANTDLDIGFSIKSIEIFRNSAEDPYSDANCAVCSDVNNLLSTFSSENFDDTCLAHLFTYRNFNGVVLGLAWVADADPGGNAGGICQRRVNTSQGEKNLNTGLTSARISNSRVPEMVSIITLSHELGHNFGARHDPVDNPNGPDCTPSDGSGNYIMHDKATDGDLPNNNKFSPCSITTMWSVIESKSSACFIEPPEAVCGNGIVETGEDCDCGTTTDNTACMEVDPCCHTNCTIRAEYECSPIADVCCEALNTQNQCQFKTSGETCSPETDCSVSATCSGTAGDCPTATPKADGTECDGGAFLCESGSCTVSICTKYGLTACSCDTNGQECDVCCTDNDNNCVSTFVLESQGATRNNETVVGVNLPAGRSCGDQTGYCDDSGQCIQVDNETPLNKLGSIFSSDGLSAVGDWLKANWWIVLIIAVGIILLVVALKCTYRRKKLSENEKRRIYGQLRTKPRPSDLPPPHPQQQQQQQQQQQFAVPEPQHSRDSRTSTQPGQQRGRRSGGGRSQFV
eukprot:Clim_evm19s246 gene=Clim_evmTU19s246